MGLVGLGKARTDQKAIGANPASNARAACVLVATELVVEFSGNRRDILADAIADLLASNGICCPDQNRQRCETGNKPECDP